MDRLRVDLQPVKRSEMVIDLVLVLQEPADRFVENDVFLGKLVSLSLAPEDFKIAHIVVRVIKRRCNVVCSSLGILITHGFQVRLKHRDGSFLSLHFLLNFLFLFINRCLGEVVGRLLGCKLVHQLASLECRAHCGHRLKEEPFVFLNFRVVLQTLRDH